MARVLLTSGPTRQYLDPVRYLTNASSGKMGAALARAMIDAGHDVHIITGPVTVEYPSEAEVTKVVTTDEMLEAAGDAFGVCDGAIGAAAPCDYRPRHVHPQKLSKTGDVLPVEFVETPDVIATLGQRKRPNQWVVGFALETEDRRFRATVKLEKKHCDLIVSNGPSAIESTHNKIEVLDSTGKVLLAAEGSKSDLAVDLVRLIHDRFYSKSSSEKAIHS